MTGVHHVLASGEYRQFQQLVSGIRAGDPVLMWDPYPSARFLIRVVSRAIFDVCMYDDDNPHRESAKNWLLGDVDAAISFRDLMSLVPLDDIIEQVFDMAAEEGVHRDRVRDMKRLLYNLNDNGSSG